MRNEAIVYILRKTSLTLKDIGKLTPKQFNALVKELQYQESVDDYRAQFSVASILAAIYNTIPRKSGKAHTAKDFYKAEKPAREHKPENTIESLAKQRGIKLPKER